ncbi:hypothetical protein [Bradyrhizobium sp.]|uniref:hypothetical protein n=1 Tax=Bradyrhizobium sp. TaxID=376 RepID=UPI002C9E260C|nr:hypothetical protein [Bradyrhizobium sp.]HMM87990.1 hypothetical protein [Bradyrhizobium sp.]
MTPSDTPADKLAATLRVFKERVQQLSDATGETADEIGLTKKEVLIALNKYRLSAGAAGA